MRLTFEQFKQKISETKAAIKKAMVAAAPKTAGKVSSTQKKRWRRTRKTAAQSACGSFWWRHAHNHHPSGRLHGWGSSTRKKVAP